MIIVFGALYFHQAYYASLEDVDTAEKHTIANKHATRPFGGAASNQAFSANRMGSKTALVGTVADDFDGTRIMTRLKRYGVVTSGIAARDHTFLKEHVTGAQTFIMTDEHTVARSFTAAGVNQKTSDDQVPDELLISKNLILTQSELPHAVTDRLVSRAKAKNIRVIHTHYDGLPHDNQRLSSKPDISLGAAALSKSIKVEDKDGPKFIDMPEMSPYIFDSFCGTFASAYYALEDIEAATQYGLIAASLTIKNKNMYDYYQHDINELYEKTHDSDDEKS